MRGDNHTTLRVMHVIREFDLGGSQEVAIDMCLGLASRGHQPLIVTLFVGTGSVVAQGQRARLFRGGIATREFDCTSQTGLTLLGTLRLAALIRRWRPDVVHSHSDVPDFALSIAARLSPAVLARTIHNTVFWPGRPRTARFVESGFVDDLVIGCSADALAAYVELRRSCGLAPSPIRSVVPNGVTIPEAPASREELCARFKADPGKVQLCFAGRFVEQKGIDVLAQAWALLGEAERAGAELHLFGSGQLSPENLFPAADLGRSVVVHTPEPGLSRWFGGFDAVILPSRFEGFPLVALEALAAGALLVATDAPGLREALPPDWPLKVPGENPPALAEALRDIIAGRFDTAHRDKGLRDKGLAWVRARYSRERMIDSYEQAYLDYLGGPHARPCRP